MSDVKQKVRIELIDKNTGKYLTDVDAITSAEVIYYSNENPIPKNVGDLPAGTTFDEVPLNIILDNLLYSYTSPTIQSISTTSPDFPSVIKESKELLKEKGSTVNSFRYIVSFTAGTEKILTCILKIYKDDAKTYKQTAQIEAKPGSSYTAEFEIPDINIGSNIEISIFDGRETVVGPYLKYTFVDPIFVGFMDPDILDDNYELLEENMENIYDRVTATIENNPDQLQKRFSIIRSDQQSFSMNLDYDHKKKANPAILIPSYWGNISSITDTHGNNIINSFTVLSGLHLKVSDTIETTEYLFYMCKQSFDLNSLLLKGITYHFDEQISEVSDLNGNGIPIITGFDVNCQSPIDSRFCVKTYEDLITKIEYPYNGLITFVDDINTSFKYNNGEWLPTSNRLILVENESELTEDKGGWDDVAIDVSNGNVHRKRYNNVWELWGNLRG